MSLNFNLAIPHDHALAMKWLMEVFTNQGTVALCNVIKRCAPQEISAIIRGLWPEAQKNPTLKQVLRHLHRFEDPLWSTSSPAALKVAELNDPKNPGEFETDRPSYDYGMSQYVERPKPVNPADWLPALDKLKATVKAAALAARPGRLPQGLAKETGEVFRLMLAAGSPHEALKDAREFFRAGLAKAAPRRAFFKAPTGKSNPLTMDPRELKDRVEDLRERDREERRAMVAAGSADPFALRKLPEEGSDEAGLVDTFDRRGPYRFQVELREKLLKLPGQNKRRELLQALDAFSPGRPVMGIVLGHVLAGRAEELDPIMRDVAGSMAGNDFSEDEEAFRMGRMGASRQGKFSAPTGKRNPLTMNPNELRDLFDEARERDREERAAFARG